jgi:translation initiation factor IF-2
MKTLTELSGSLIRMAAVAVAEAKRSIPKEEPVEPVLAEEPAKEAPAAAIAEAAGADEAPPEEAAAKAGEKEAAAEPKEEAAPPEAKDADAKEKGAARDEEAESDAVKAALDAAVAAATGLSGNRLALLRDAVKVVGRRTEDVRLVRVFGPEEKVSGAKVIGDFQFLVDFSPANMKQAMTAPKKDRGGRGGGGGGGGGRSGGRGGAGGGVKAGTTGGFSMDSLREDRKNERGGGGRPGGGRKPGGGRPGGSGRPGGGQRG